MANTRALESASNEQCQGVAPAAPSSPAAAAPGDEAEAEAVLDGRLVLVSNRLPITLGEDGSLRMSGGGLATGLLGPHERSRGLWLGWLGAQPADELPPAAESAAAAAAAAAKLAEALAARRLVSIPLSVTEVTDFYEGFSNGVLWPLFHYLIDRLPFEKCERWWAEYVRVNQKFANAVAERYEPGDLVWVHDYQLMLVPAMLRARVPGARIGFFLHIPFPSVEVVRLLPWAGQLLMGVLGADVVGFHTLSYVRQFINALILVNGMWPQLDHVVVNGRTVALGAFPMGVDATAFATYARDPEVVAAAAKLRAGLPEGGKLLVGVDRLDYTKGVPRRLLAVERLLETQPSLRAGQLRFLQIAVPSRESVPQYEAFVSDVFRVVGRINGRFSTPESVPVHFLHQSFSQRDLVAFFLAADVMLVTPLRDGMNLVAKEYVASCSGSGGGSGGRGMLVLSEFAGCAAEMGSALLINPYDIHGTSASIFRALFMAESERAQRMATLSVRVREQNVHFWAASFLRMLVASGRDADCAAGAISALRAASPFASLHRIAQAPRVEWLLDYDGTLVDIEAHPSLCGPSTALLELLDSLAASPGFAVNIVSGRSRSELETWFGHLHAICLHAQHGLWSQKPPAAAADGGGKAATSREWSANVKFGLGWVDSVRRIFLEFVARTPGSFVEEKGGYGIAWHYRKADAEQGKIQASELRLHLSHVLSSMPLRILLGRFVIEVLPEGVSKSVVARAIVARAAPGTFFVGAGDDATDDDIFTALHAEKPDDSLTIAVGALPRCASTGVAGPGDLKLFLAAAMDERRAAAAPPTLMATLS